MKHNEPKFFFLIIGTEILNRRRQDRHFDFVSQALLERGYKLSGSFTIEDDPELIVKTLKFLAEIPESVVFSFGGIGSTPDDHTRLAAAEALRDGKLVTQPEAKAIIEERLKTMEVPDKRYPLRMAELPEGARLLKNNPVNGMPGFYLDDRFFFVPGFPEMAHPMILEALDRFFPHQEQKSVRKTLTALTRESALIDVMEHLPEGVELSSLPKLYSDGPRVVISLSGEDPKAVQEAYDRFVQALEERDIPYSEGDDTSQ
ncbi:competence/damage-inducible protein A [Nitratifractor salsuginis]|uniref:Molybdopterin binding domain protein n=1 Tax=Nitratifractor salsuginis (strain DSM 16511 / JCM 12458 / E9I37-1) TaxID=749222 RepID=E6WZN8_NITSE|nr:molybdopterin-binding protein [Nitratifractor salsuginis]ADV46679.1 molybdopterin binding domain protein [Nitratifractor salsuginis DSM 16511]